MKRIRVPAKILSAVEQALAQYSSTANLHWSQDLANLSRVACEAFAKALSEHPQVPTDEQWNELLKEFPPCDFLKTYGFAQIFDAWQRRCFVQEEPEIDEIWMPFVRNAPQDATAMTIYGANDTVLAKIDLEAFRRGLRKGEQK